MELAPLVQPSLIENQDGKPDPNSAVRTFTSVGPFAQIRKIRFPNHLFQFSKIAICEISVLRIEKLALANA
jgi:hypothetical protein